MQFVKLENKVKKMIECVGNLWSYKPDAQVRVITTNGEVNPNGKSVMGKGCALEAALMFPPLPKMLGDRIKKNGNKVQVFNKECFGADFILATLPVKYTWRSNADTNLIFKSVSHLVDLADYFNWESIIMPRPGCGAGNLDWDKVVKPLIKILLDDRFCVITWDTHGD